MSSGAQSQPLEAFRILSLPPDFYYIPDFISVEEEASILSKIPAQRWVTLSHRRLQAHPSTLTKNNVLLAASLPPYLTNPIVQRFKDLGIFEHTPHKQPNHVLINEYRRGEGIMAHEDGGAYAPVVATVSLGASICLDITSKPPAASSNPSTPDGKSVQDAEVTPRYAVPTRILQEPRSLLITTGAAYEDLLHGISDVQADEDLGEDTVVNWGLLGDKQVFQQSNGRNERATRVSLTYRDVLKVSTAATKVFGALGKK